MIDCSNFANVILDLKAPELKDKLFSYAIPENLAKETFAGTQVLVPFGQNSLVGGYVVSISNEAPPGVVTKSIVEVLDPEPLFSPEYLDFLASIAEYYCTGLTNVVSAAVPAFLAPRLKRRIKLLDVSEANRDISLDFSSKLILEILGSTKNKTLAITSLRQKWCHQTKRNQAQFYRSLSTLRQYKLVDQIPDTSDLKSPKTIKVVIWTGAEPIASSQRHKEIVSTLTHHGGQLPLCDLLKMARTTSATIKKMAYEGILEISEIEEIRDPLKRLGGFASKETRSELVLLPEQAHAVTVLTEELDRLLTQSKGQQPAPIKTTTTPWLLHGVTGSGKTEIYLRLIAHTLQQGRTALMLVPEISLTPQLAGRLTERFDGRVALWHSNLSDGERYDTWRRLKAGQSQVLLGARSAVLVDIPNLGLIILDEEHDSSYKQSNPAPRYHTKHVAQEKASRNNSLLLLGSATPDLASYHEAKTSGQLLELPKRVFDQPLPETKLVDMRDEFLSGNRSIFSQTLKDALANSLSQKEQSILLLNRRGFASHVFCRACGYVVVCNNCSVSLVYHEPSREYKSNKQSDASGALNGYLSCHHCGYHLANLTECPSCKGSFIRPYGLGTQRVEIEIKSLFPIARVLRLDSDIAKKRGAYESILGQFSAGQADILIGTQMVAKGLDVENVTLVGILAADAAFNMPDYRTIERGFQLLTQVSGRTGRGLKPGSVVLQTYQTELPALHWARNHNYQSLYESELAARQAFDYPPFSQLIRIIIAADDPDVAEHACEILAEELSQYLQDALPASAVDILGPAPCLLEKLRGKFRMHLVIKNKAGTEGHRLITSFLKAKRFREDVIFAVDIDAIDLF